MPTKTARATAAASIDPDARQFSCVILSHFVRHELSGINDLHRTHRAPPNDERKKPKTPGSRGADLSFVRPIGRRLTHNLNTMNRLPLCPHNARFFGLLRPSCVGNPTPPPTTHISAPTRECELLKYLQFR
jgi:hypothetical protein